MQAQVSSGSTDGYWHSCKIYVSSREIAIDGTNLYVVGNSNNHTIRKIVISTGAVTTLAGSAGSSGSTGRHGYSSKI